jgi:hypothetical protein
VSYGRGFLASCIVNDYDSSLKTNHATTLLCLRKPKLTVARGLQKYLYCIIGAVPLATTTFVQWPN